VGDDGQFARRADEIEVPVRQIGSHSLDEFAEAAPNLAIGMLRIDHRLPQAIVGGRVRGTGGSVEQRGRQHGRARFTF
jgi:hypothetical protein